MRPTLLLELVLRRTIRRELLLGLLAAGRARLGRDDEDDDAGADDEAATLPRSRLT